MRRGLLAWLVLLSPSLAWAGTTYNPFTNQPDKCSTVVEEDGSPSATACQTVEVPNNSLTDDGDGNFSLSFAAGSGDITRVGDCTASDCFEGTSGTSLTLIGSAPTINWNSTVGDDFEQYVYNNIQFTTDSTTGSVLSSLTSGGRFALPQTLSSCETVVTDNQGRLRCGYADGRSIDVRSTGAACDGVTDDAKAIQAAINQATLTNGTVLFPGGTCKVNSQLTWDISKVSLVGNGTTLDMSGVLSGYALRPTASPGNNDWQNNAQTVFRGFNIKGGDVDGVTALILAGSDVNHSVAGWTVDTVGFSDWETTIEAGSFAWDIKFDHCTFDAGAFGTTFYMPNGLATAGEHFSFINSFFFNSYLVFDINYPNGAVHVINSSIDYSPVIADLSAGTLFITNSWIEGNSSSDYWFKLSGQGSLQIDNSMINITANLDQSLIQCTSSNAEKGVVLDNIMLSVAAMSANETETNNTLISGSCPAVSIGNVHSFVGDKQISMSPMVNAMRDAGFEQSTVLDGAGSGTLPTIDATTAHTGSQSLKLGPGDGTGTSIYEVTVEVLPGQRPTVSYWYKLNAAYTGSGQSVFGREIFLDRNDNVLFTMSDITKTAEVDWSHRTAPFLTTGQQPPLGTTKMRFQITAELCAGGCTAWIDDVVINVLGNPPAHPAPLLQQTDISISEPSPTVTLDATGTNARDIEWWNDGQAWGFGDTTNSQQLFEMSLGNKYRLPQLASGYVMSASGTLGAQALPIPLSHGGTGAQSLTGGRCVQVNDQGTALTVAGASCGVSTGDSLSVNSTSATDMDLLNGDIDWTLDTGASPDSLTATVGCADCVTLTTETSGNYVTSVATTGSLTGGAAASEGATLTLDVADDTIDGTELADTLTLDALLTLSGNDLTLADATPTFTWDATSGRDIEATLSASAFYLTDPTNSQPLLTISAGNVIRFPTLGSGYLMSAGGTLGAQSLPIPVSHGGTGATSFTGSRLVSSTATGTAFEIANSTTLGTGTFTTLTLDAGTCDPRLTSASGTLTLGCVNGTNNESLTWDFETDANLVAVSTATGVTDLNLDGTINFGLDDRGELRLYETDINGDAYLAFKPPAAVTTSRTCTFEDDASFIPDSCVGDGVDDGASSTTWDVIGDPAGAGTVAFGTTQQLLTSTLDSATAGTEAALEIDNSDADLSNDTILQRLQFSGDASDANAIYLSMEDSSGVQYEFAEDALTLNSITEMDLADTVLLDLSSINMSSTTEGLKLGQATDCSSATAEGQVCWETDEDVLHVGDGSTDVEVGWFPVATGDNTGSTATFYMAPFIASSTTLEADVNQFENSQDWYCRNLHVGLATAPGSGKTWTVTARDDGSDTALTCATGNSTECNDTSNAVTIAANSTVTWGFVPSGGTPTSAARVSVSMQCRPD